MASLTVIACLLFYDLWGNIDHTGFLFAMAARFGYGSNGSGVRCGELPEGECSIIFKVMRYFKQYSL
jgi:hypothetical protein